MPFANFCRMISIHAPTRGATDFIVSKIAFVQFQSTLPQGERRYCNQIATCLHGFQSTLPQGERRFKNYKLAATAKFQSTLPQGERRTQRSLISSAQLFQSTLPQGERLYAFHDCWNYIEFQSTLPQGERLAEGVRNTPYMGISIHAPTRGATSRPWHKSISFL